MELSKTPRRKKALLYSLGVVGLALALAVVVTVQRREISADVASDGLTIEDVQGGFNLLVKVVDANGSAVPAFLDANIDTDGNCSVDDNESGLGVVGETEVDGSGSLSLEHDVSYTITASAKDDNRKGTAGVALGSASKAACAQSVNAGQTEPIEIKVN